MSLIFHAPNVHQGGGLVLIRPLLQILASRKDIKFILDSRLPEADKAILKGQGSVKYIQSTLASRLAGEWHLRKITEKNDTVLCFANLPPLFPLKTQKIILFVQNPRVVNKSPLRILTFKVACRIFLERLWLKWRISENMRCIVQTTSMRKLLASATSNKIKNAEILSLVSSELFEQNTQINSLQKNYDFIYVATPDKHKHHLELIDAWCLLAEENIKPSLIVTCEQSQNPSLHAYLQQKIQEFSLNITNKGYCEHKEILNLYLQSTALIFPSVAESFGLPLLEAKQAGLPILASELDYVRDLVEPAQTFDSYSPLSIARAVKRFLKLPQEPIKLVNAQTFLDAIERGS